MKSIKLGTQAPKWMVGIGWLERPVRHHAPAASESRRQFLESQRGPAGVDSRARSLPTELPPRPVRPAVMASSRRQAAPPPAVAVLALLMAGCASMAPSYEVPTLPVPLRYAAAAGQDGASVASIGWRDYFTDPQLQVVIALALDNNRDLRMALLRVEEARAGYGIQRADLFPSFGAQASLDRFQIPAALTPTGEPLVGSLYLVGLSLASWEIDFWGRVRSLQDAALETYLATDAARRAASIALVAQVANDYLVLRELDERIALARQTIASRQESFRIVSRRVEVGASARLNLTQVQTLLTQAQALGVQLEQARAAQFHALTLLVGAPIALAPAADRVDQPRTMRELKPGLPSDLLLQRPDIVAAEHRLKAANANIGAARAAFFPRVTLTGSAGSATTELDDLFMSGSRAWIFSPSISLPIFDGARRRNNLSLAEARRDLAVASYEKAVQTAFRDVSDALSALAWLGQQVAIAQTGLATQTERARLSQLRYDNGATAFLDVLDAQRDLLAAQQQLVQTQRALLTSRVSLYAALGGGSLERVAVADGDSREHIQGTNSR